MPRLRGLWAYSASALALALFYGIASGVFDRALLWLLPAGQDPFAFRLAHLGQAPLHAGCRPAVITYFFLAPRRRPRPATVFLMPLRMRAFVRVR